MPELGFRAVDADNHYYEAPDAFTRHLDPALHKRAMQWAEIGGRRRLLVAGKLNRYIPNPTWDPVARPGSLDAYFRGRNTDGTDVRTLFGALDRLADHPEYQDRDARLAVMDAQGLEAALFFPTLGVGMQESLRHDVPVLHAAFSAFNRWLEEDWGWAYQDRIVAAAVLTLADVDLAVAETERVLAAGARVVCMVPGPVPGIGGRRRSPALPEFDPVWARLDEAGVTVAIHAGDGGLHDELARWESTGARQAFRSTAFSQVVSHGRLVTDTLAAMVCHGLFDRFRNLRVLSVENGGHWVPHLLHELALAYGKAPQDFGRDPVEALREHLWVSPFYEDDMERIAAELGLDRLVFGSDWPHAEGLADPTAFAADVPWLDDAGLRTVMRDAALGLLTPRPAGARV